MATIPKVIKNMNLIIEGQGFAGLIDEVSLPDLSLVTEDHRAGGMDMPIKLDMGMEPLELSFKSAEFTPSHHRLFGHQNQNAVPLQFRAAMADDAETWPYIIKATGMITKLSGGSITNGSKTSLEVMMSLRFYELSINGEELIHIDTANMVRRISGFDHLEGQRNALGL